MMENKELILDTDAPDIVWLQWNGDSDPDDYDDLPEGVTWAVEQIWPHDIEYVRADLVRDLLKGHKCSELIGDSGLIAATMRALSANES